MNPSLPPRVRVWLIASLALPALLLGGCYSRKEAVLVTNRLGSASEETGKLVAQMKTSDAANVAALKELHAAFLTLQKEQALAAVSLKEAGFLQTLDNRQSALLIEFGADRTRFITAFASQVTESTKPLAEKEAALAKAATDAHAAAEKFPHDKDRALAKAQADAAYLALGTARIQLVAGAGLQAYHDSDHAVVEESAKIATLAEDARQKIRAAAVAARARINAQKPPATTLPEPGTAAHDALAAYVKAVRASSDSFANYLQSNSLATKSFLGSFVSGFGTNIVEAVTGALRGDALPKPADVIKDGNDILKTLYEEILADNDTNGKALVGQFEKDAQKAGTDLLKLAGEKAKAHITAKLPDVLKAPAPAKVN